MFVLLRPCVGLVQGAIPRQREPECRHILKLRRVSRDADTEANFLLFMFLTSHSSKEHEFSLTQNKMQLRDLTNKTLGEMVKKSGTRHKVIVISACYGGGFIDNVKDDTTLVITAARHDRQSFGCADENDFTYFGRAFFKESLPKSRSFHDAFRSAEKLIKDWEAKEIKEARKSKKDSEEAIRFRKW
jgi:hypothetical protein